MFVLALLWDNSTSKSDFMSMRVASYKRLIF